jgi:pimeloyl-ACP methyl ester carboxylesterase
MHVADGLRGFAGRSQLPMQETHLTVWEGHPVRRLAVVMCLLLMWLVPTSANAQRIESETFMIAAADPGIQLHVRNNRLEGRDSFPGERVVLFVHGATYPSETVFDIDLPGGSWADHVARKGYDVHLVDVRGYGRSTRPAAMEASPADQPGTELS